jgi:hypothetical protein
MALVKQLGPKKVEPFDPAALEADIRLLGHGLKRGAGMGELYRQNHQSVSRRDPGRMGMQVRHDLAVDHRRHLRRIEWLTPGVIWAMDATECEERAADGLKIHLHNTQDLGSRYKFFRRVSGKGRDCRLSDRNSLFGIMNILGRQLCVKGICAQNLALGWGPFQWGSGGFSRQGWPGGAFNDWARPVGRI